jgi:hypothetical protein
VDGVVLIEDVDAQPGSMLRGRITSASDYDLTASVLRDAAGGRDSTVLMTGDASAR